MKTVKTASILLILLLGIFGVPLRTSAEGQWHFQAALEVPGPGLTEALLPADLFFSGGTTGPDSLLDLSLEGPDGNPRSFELYWKEENSTRILVLEASRVYLDKTRGLIWEAAPPRNFKIENIHIEFAARQEMGQVSIEAMDFRGWHRLAENAALYRVEDGLRADIRIEPAVYEQLRLFFRGYDKDFRETPFLVKSVSLSGKNIAKDYAEETVNLHFIEAKQEGEKVISALFPGSGLWIKSLFVSTEAQFQGEWKLGREIIGGNGPRFQELLSGRVTTVSGKASRMEIPVNRFWPGRSLVLKLDPGGRYLGKIAGMRITTHLPRVVFFADKAGVYLAQAGSGNRALVKEFSGDPERRIDRVLSFSEVTENRTWRPESLAEKFLIKGGPFTEKGYRWTAKVRIPEPGYYRIVLNREASLFPHPDSIRLVREGVQVPFFKGQYETREIDLRASSEYDAVKNVTCWTIELPGPAGQLKELTLGTQGIFQRNVNIDIPKAGHTGWQRWKELYWQNLENAPAVLRAGLEGAPKDIRELRITMDHGDNRPIELKTVKAVYYAPALLFLINEPGEYALFGGNPETQEAKYDLALVQAHLMEAVPRPAVMEEFTHFRSTSLKSDIQEVFDDKSWGLYAVLGLVTLVLLLLIIKLFPRERKGGKGHDQKGQG